MFDYTDAPRQPPPNLVRRRQVRGKGICASCFNTVKGEVDYPSAEDCKEFFGGDFEQGDAICFWCLEAWVLDPLEITVHGHA